MKDKIEEVSYAVVKGGVGSIPFVGGVLSELFGAAFSDPATKRKEQVLMDMDDRLRKLEEDGFDMQKLSESDEFLSIAMQAYNIALRTHQVEKRAALMNAITNTPKLDIDENEKLMMLNYIDTFNEWHLRILAFLDNSSNFFPEGKPSYYMAGKATLLTQAYPELSSRRDFYDQVVKDLKDRGLIVYDSLHTTMSEQGLWQSGTSEIGKKFLMYITE